MTELKAAAEASKVALVGIVKDLVKRRDAALPVVAALQVELAERRAALLRDPQAAALEAAEAKLRLAEQNVYQLREYVASRAREADYAALKSDVVRMTGELNLLIQRAQRGTLQSGSVAGIALRSGSGGVR